MNCIVNVSKNWGIGNGGKLLVHLTEDLRYFRTCTEGGAVILGRKTLSTFPGGKPLRNRMNVILSRNAAPVEGARICRTLPDALRLAAEIELERPCWVIGGEQIYRQFLPYCNKALVTKTEAELPSDAFFPNLDENPLWTLIEKSEEREEGGFRFRFLTYQNTAPLSPV